MIETQWGYRKPGEHRVTHITEKEAAIGYMTAEEFARKRAKATGGDVVRREVTVIATHWQEAP